MSPGFFSNDLFGPYIPGGAMHKANGYMSEPEHGYESDYASVDAYSGIAPHKP